MSDFENWWKKEVNTIEFDLWKNKYPDNTWQYADHSTNLAWITWQAAKADSESILVAQQNTIAKLKDEINDSNEEQARLNRWLDSNRVWFENSNKEIAELELDYNRLLSDFLELEAQNNVLREALKENQFPYSANLDVYNSVVFSDGSHGTMIMESKIVKWLCRNRAKDYFDEMVKGK